MDPTRSSVQQSEQLFGVPVEGNDLMFNVQIASDEIAKPVALARNMLRRTMSSFPKVPRGATVPVCGAPGTFEARIPFLLKLCGHDPVDGWTRWSILPRGRAR